MADALASGASARKGVGVQVPPRARVKKDQIIDLVLLFCSPELRARAPLVFPGASTRRFPECFNPAKEALPAETPPFMRMNRPVSAGVPLFA